MDSEASSGIWGLLFGPEVVWPLVLAVLSVWLQQRLGSYPSRGGRASGRFRRFWRIEPHMQLSVSATVHWLKTRGRVPIDYLVRGRLPSRVWSRGYSLGLTPSSPKNLFAGRSHERCPLAVDGEAASEVRLGGFIVRVRLHPNEHPGHLRRSLRWPARHNERVLAFFPADAIGNKPGRARCFLVRTSKDSIKIGEDGIGAFAEFRSADPLGHEHGNHWEARYKDIPEDAIRIAELDDAASEASARGIGRDWESPWRRRYLPLLRWPLPMLGWTVLAGLCCAVLYYLLRFVGASGDIAARLFTVSAVALYFELLFSAALVASTVVSRAWDYWRHERRWGPGWTAGTTGCIEDAELARNGIESEPQPDGPRSPFFDTSSLPVRLRSRRPLPCVLRESQDAVLDWNDAAENHQGSLSGRLFVEFRLEPTPRLAWRFETNDSDAMTKFFDGSPPLLSWTSPDGARHLPLLVTEIKPAAGRTRLSGRESSAPVEDFSTAIVHEVRFDTVNFAATTGTANVRDANRSIELARHQWDRDGWRIILDKQADIDWRGPRIGDGYQVTHIGSLTRTDGAAFRYGQAEEVLDCLYWFLSFVQGRRVGITLPTGLGEPNDAPDERTPLVESWKAWYADPAGSGIGSWYPTLEAHALHSLLQAFHHTWSTDEVERDRIRFLITVYCTATAQNTLVEPRFLMAYLGLESIAGDEVTEGESLNVAVHLSKALERFGIPLKEESLQNPDLDDPVRQLVAVRNGIIHPNQAKPASWTWTWPDHVKHAWPVALWMLEVLLLNRLGYDGPYNNHVTWELEALPRASTKDHEQSSSQLTAC